MAKRPSEQIFIQAFGPYFLIVHYLSIYKILELEIQILEVKVNGKKTTAILQRERDVRT